MPKVLAQLSMNVMDGSKQSPLIARVIQLIASNPHLRYRVHALATDIEGNYCSSQIKKCYFLNR